MQILILQRSNCLKIKMIRIIRGRQIRKNELEKAIKDKVDINVNCLQIQFAGLKYVNANCQLSATE